MCRLLKDQWFFRGTRKKMMKDIVETKGQVKASCQYIITGKSLDSNGKERNETRCGRQFAGGSYLYYICFLMCSYPLSLYNLLITWTFIVHPAIQQKQERTKWINRLSNNLSIYLEKSTFALWKVSFLFQELVFSLTTRLSHPHKHFLSQPLTAQCS